MCCTALKPSLQELAWMCLPCRAAVWAWEQGVTPQLGIRALGPWGAQLCDGYVSRRFGDGLPAHEVEWFKRYFYQQLAAKVCSLHHSRLIPDYHPACRFPCHPFRQKSLQSTSLSNSEHS